MFCMYRVMQKGPRRREPEVRSHPPRIFPQSKVTNEKNRPLADALYELADFVLHGDAIQKGLSYQKAAKSVREAKQPITSKDVALKLTGVGKSVGGKIEEYVKEGKIQVLEEYRSGKRGK